MRGQMNAGKFGDPEKPSLLQRLMNYWYSPGEQMPDHDIISECIGHMYVPRLSNNFLSEYCNTVQDGWN